MISLVDSDDSFLFRCIFSFSFSFPPKLMNGTQGIACFVLMSIPLPLSSVAPDYVKPVTIIPFSCPVRGSLQGSLLGKVLCSERDKQGRNSLTITWRKEFQEPVQCSINNSPNTAGPSVAFSQWTCLSPPSFLCSD